LLSLFVVLESLYQNIPWHYCINYRTNFENCRHIYFILHQAVSTGLTEEDIPGAKQDVSVPALQKLKCHELKFWLQRRRGDSCKGVKTKAQLIQRYVCRKNTPHLMLIKTSECHVFVGK
jgi:hypothetical protein